MSDLYGLADRRIVVSVDMESYSRRNNVLQHRAQEAFQRILEKATAEAHLDRVNWVIQQGGDGELAILPPGTNERAVVATLAPTVDRLLRDHNQGFEAGAKIRLRIAIHQGIVHLDGANGFPGEAVVHVSRLIDAPPLKSALRTFPGAAVALILSDTVYRDVVEHYRDLRPDQFARVAVEIPDKHFSAIAWIYVPGENAAGPGTTTPAESAPPAGSQIFRDITANGPATFGNHNRIEWRGDV